VKIRTIVKAGLLAATMSVAGIAAGVGPASAHTLTGGSAQATCVDGSVVVTWTYTSGDAGAHTIQSVTFDRAVASSSHTTTTITATTHETPGATVSLTATAVFEDGFHAPRTVTTTIPTSICPPTTTTTTTNPTPPPGTVAPPTTVPPPVTTVPPTTVPTTVPPTTVASTVPPAPPGSVVGPPPAPPAVSQHVGQLPPTGSERDGILIVIGMGVAALFVGVVLLWKAHIRRRS
jgi:hypothetical protein